MLYSADEVKPPEAYTHTKPKYVKFIGKWHACNAWNKLLPRLCADICYRHYDETTIDLFRYELYELSKRPNSPKFVERYHERYSDINVTINEVRLEMHVSTSSSAKRTVIKARTLIRYFGYSDSDLEFIVE